LQRLVELYGDGAVDDQEVERVLTGISGPRDHARAAIVRGDEPALIATLRAAEDALVM
jgi:hypothetical protein